MTKKIQLEESKQIDVLLPNKVVSKLVLFGVSANEKRPRRQEEAMEGYGAVVGNNSKGEIWFAKKIVIIEKGTKYLMYFSFNQCLLVRLGKRNSS